MTLRSLEALAAFHCAPALAGIKAANLFSWQNSDRKARGEEIESLRTGLAPHGVSVEILCECDRYVLIYVYRDALLRRSLTPESGEFLEELGYPSGSGTKEKIAALKNRFAQGCGFPHEIGLFLDYPLEDVKGFIDDPRGGFSVCGFWKVYGDKESALARFESYRACTEEFCKKFDEGLGLAGTMEALPAAA